MTTDETTPPRAPPEPAGFVGLGMMGARIAGRLQSRGASLVVYNRDPTKAQPLVAAGARSVARPSDVARAVGAGVTFLMLTDGRAVARVLFGRGGLARALPVGATVVDLSTIDPDESRAHAERLARQGVSYLDCPVGGSIGPAERGELTLFVGGSAEAAGRARPWLDLIGRRVELMGPSGAGSSMKLVNNLLTIATVAMLGEALSLAEAFDLPGDRVIDLLRIGGGASAMLEGKQANLRARNYPPAFLLPLARKDLRLIERAARRAGRPAAITREARRLTDEAIELGHARDDFSSVVEAARARRIGSRHAASPGPSTDRLPVAPGP